MRNPSRLLVVVAAAALTGLPPGSARAECLQLVNGQFNVNGIVVGKPLNGGGTPPATCPPDTGWGGTIARPLIVFGGQPDTHVANLFFAGLASGATVGKIFLGLHVENDDAFSNQDVAVVYLDANNNNEFGAGDFAVRFTGPSTPATGEACGLDPGTSAVFRHDGTAWVQDPALSAAVAIKASADYDASAADPESNLWEAEISIDAAALGINLSAANGKLGMGAKLYVGEGIGATLVYRFPAGLTTDDLPNDNGPNDGGVTAANLAKVDVGACSLDVQLVDITGTDAAGNAGKFTRFPGAIAGTLPETQRNHFTAKVQLVNPNNPGDTSAVAVPDTGDVTFEGLPYNAGFLATIPFGKSTASFSQVGQIRNVEAPAGWPADESQYQPFRGVLSIAGHICYRVRLSGFPVNLNEAGDVMQKNLLFTSLSARRETFLVQAPDKGDARTGFHPPPHHRGKVELLLRPRWYGVPARLVAKPGQHQRGRWSFGFPRAKKNGITDAGRGYFRLQLKPGEQRAIELELRGASMPLTTQRVHVPPNAAGPGERGGEKAPVVRVRPGAVLTVFATGEVKVDDEHPASGPEGVVEKPAPEPGPDLKGGDAARGEGGGSPRPPTTAFQFTDHVGALIGSFDGFRSTFVAGASMTLTVPDGTEELAFAVNDRRGRYGDNRGAGFEVTVLASEGQSLPTRMSRPGNPANGLPAAQAPGANLPRLDIDVWVLDRKPRAARPIGYVSYAVFASHAEGGPRPPPGRK